MAQATAPILDSTITTDRALTADGRLRWHSGHRSALARMAGAAKSAGTIAAAERLADLVMRVAGERA